jgi:hypothetical protein
VFEDPVPELYVALVEYQPGIVELSAHGMFVPVDASPSKFSVSGTPKAVMLPPFVSAKDGPRSDTVATTTIAAMPIRNETRFDIKVRGVYGQQPDESMQ